MRWFSMYAKGHHGYPQPEDSWDTHCFQSACVRCGRRSLQVAPLRVRRQQAPHSEIIQLNWLFDVFLVAPVVLSAITDAGVTGFGSSPLLIHKTGARCEERIQLCVGTEIDCVETSLLPTVTCCPDNEESMFGAFGGTKRYPPSTPYCGAVKFHPPTSISIRSTAVLNAPDMFLSQQWFGSGGNAFRLTLCSERVVETFTQNGFRGVSFEPVSMVGTSKREN
jgi:hypothetical protein